VRPHRDVERLCRLQGNAKATRQTVPGALGRDREPGLRERQRASDLVDGAITTPGDDRAEATAGEVRGDGVRMSGPVGQSDIWYEPPLLQHRGNGASELVASARVTAGTRDRINDDGERERHGQDSDCTDRRGVAVWD